MAGLLTVTIVIALAGSVDADDWPRWRGPNGDQTSTETGWNPQALSTPRILWEAQIGTGHSTFAIEGGWLFTTGNRTLSETIYEEIVFCLDAVTGAERWRHTYHSHEGETFFGPEATPFIDGDRVYTVGRSGHVFCLDKATGQVRWQRDVMAEGMTKTDQWGVVGSPIIDGDLLLLNIGSAGAAFNKLTGETVWSSEVGICGMASPVVFDHQGKRLAAMQALKTLNIVDVKSGEKLWSYEWNSYQDAVYMGDNLFLTGGREGKVGGSVMLAWTGEEPKVVWNHRRNEAAFQGWVVKDGHAYGFFRSGRRSSFRCVRLADGEIVWEEKLGEWGSFTMVDGKLVIITGKGEAIIAEASSAAFKPISRARVLHLPEQTDADHDRACFIWTHPVLANGLLYARNTHGDMVCVDLRGE
jgi:outer membrane protein assembly factor BamB